MDELNQLQNIFSALGRDDRHSLLRYAQFLHAERGSDDLVEPQIEKPLDFPRPKNEHVVVAIRRLAKTYPMLNHDHLLRQSADFMSAHLVSGRSATEVINELEEIFQMQYQKYRSEFSR